MFGLDVISRDLESFFSKFSRGGDGIRLSRLMFGLLAEGRAICRESGECQRRLPLPMNSASRLRS
jgi:hypothetical protein